MSLLAHRTRPAQTAWDYLPEFAGEQLPRYTSYPPANRFSDRVGPDAARAARSELSPDAAISLYVHIPFCKKLCWYCGCHTSVPTLSDPVDAYLDALKQEIALVADDLPAGARVTRLHFGGGSPDILLPRQMEGLLTLLRDKFRFSRFAEIAAELDPRGLSQDLVRSLGQAGFNRASLGVQVLNPAVQERINRIQPPEMISNAIQGLREAGVQGVNIDMMYGLPGQTAADVIETALFASTQDVDRIAVFGYAHVPWMKKHQKAIRVEDLPSGEARFRQAEAAADTLVAGGYMPVGFDHFAAPGDSLATAERQGRLHRNFQGYTDDESEALIGLGASAISSLPGLIYQNAADTGDYKAALAERRLPVVRGIPLSADDHRIAQVIERVLCDFEVFLESDLHIAACSRLAPLVHAGLITMTGNHLTVTARGRPYVRSVAACFDPGFAPKPGVHSLAV